MTSFPVDSVHLIITFTIIPKELFDILLDLKDLIIAKHLGRGVVDVIRGEDFLENLNPANQGERPIVPFIKLLIKIFLDPEPHVFEGGGPEKGAPRYLTIFLGPPHW